MSDNIDVLDATGQTEVLGALDEDSVKYPRKVNYLQEKIPVWLTVVVGTPGTPTPLASNGTFATSIRMFAKRDDGVNVDLVFLRGSAVDKDTNQGHTLIPGDTWSYQSRPDAKFDLNDFSIDGIDTDDSVVLVYEPA